MFNHLGKNSKKPQGVEGGIHPPPPLIRPRVNLTKKPCLTVHFVLFCSLYFLLHFISLRNFIRNVLEIRSDSSPRMPRHSWDIFAVQSAKFEKLRLLTKKPKVPIKWANVQIRKLFWIISHHLLTVSSFIIYQFTISPQNRKLPSCIGLLMRNRDKSSFAVNQVCLPFGYSEGSTFSK